ncbi:MAG TPA: hypothetical protein VMQ61_10260 [Thermoanaerobaculia bacterium]|nr:hypothetical protein [Thermoanaerobaculia bacterium]
MHRVFSGLLALGCAAAVFAHVTPNVTLVRKGDFLKEALPGATKYFEKHLMLAGSEGAAIRQATGWTPTDEDTKVYVGRDDAGGLVGSVVFLWMPSQHGPVGVAVAFDAGRVVRRVTVTDVGTEPLVWVRPLLEGGGLKTLEGLPLGSSPDAARLTPPDAGAMTRYYAGIVAAAVVRAQKLEALSSP